MYKSEIIIKFIKLHNCSKMNQNIINHITIFWLNRTLILLKNYFRELLFIYSTQKLNLITFNRYFQVY